MERDTSFREQLGVRPIINVSGTMTHLGASIVVPQAAAWISAILPEFVELGELHRLASRTISRLTGAEAGFVTASAAAGLTIGCAAAMTGSDVGRIEKLPDASQMNNEVLIQLGHMVSYGAPVTQGIRLSGATPVTVGDTNSSNALRLAGRITDKTVAAMYVVSHHTVQYGMLPLKEFSRVCHDHGVPVICDLASEYDLRCFLEDGCDLAIYSAHKFLGGPTAGIIAGKKELVRACYLQNMGIGRGMKVGKEGIVGTIAALNAWEHRDHVAIRTTETRALTLWLQAVSSYQGISATIEPDPTQNPLDRLKVTVNPVDSGITAWDLARRLAAGDPPVMVRDHESERGHFYLDPCNLHAGEEATVAERLVTELDWAKGHPGEEASDLAEVKSRRLLAQLSWPD
jgi:D-glucosaminate-6-phosphate ammonia-lyase